MLETKIFYFIVDKSARKSTKVR